MTYGTKYRMTVRSQDGYEYRWEIRRQGWAGGVTDLIPAYPAFDLQYGRHGQPDLMTPFLPSRVELFVIDNPSGLLQEVTEYAERSFMVVGERRFVGGSPVWLPYWVGFIAPSVYEDYPNEYNAVVRLMAVEEIQLLEGLAYYPANDLPGDIGTVWARFIGVFDAMASDLTRYAFNSRLYPWMSDLEETDLPLLSVAVRDSVLQGEQTEIDVKEALTRLLRAFSLQLMQASGNWYVLHTPRPASGMMRLWEYEQFGTPISNGLWEIGGIADTDMHEARWSKRMYERRAKSVEVIHAFSDAFTQMIENGSLEAWASGVPTGWVIPFSDRIEQMTGANALQGSSSLALVGTNAANDRIAAQVSSRGRTAQGVHQIFSLRAMARFTTDGSDPETTLRFKVNIGGYQLSRRTLEASGVARVGRDVVLPIVAPAGTAGTPLVPKGQELRFGKHNRVTLRETLRAGMTEIRVDAEGEHGGISGRPRKADGEILVIAGATAPYYVFLTADGVVEETVGGGNDDSGNALASEVQVRAHMVTPTGDEVPPARVEVDFYQPYRTTGGGTITADRLTIDDVVVSLDEEGGAIRKARTIAEVSTDGEAVTMPEVYIGDGPEPYADGALVLNDGTSWRQDLLSGDWSIGPSATPSGDLLHEARATEIARHLRRTVAVHEARFLLRGGQTIFPFSLVYRSGVPCQLTYLRIAQPMAEATVEMIELHPAAGSAVATSTTYSHL
jgi:hypothetical protein